MPRPERIRRIVKRRLVKTPAGKRPVKHASAPSAPTVRQINPLVVYFGQQHSHSVPFFKKHFGERWHKVLMSESPHCLLYKGDETLYREYLSFSWQYHQIPMTKADEWIAKKRILFDDIKKSGIQEPVRVFQDRQRRYYCMDGNHRLSSAIALGHKTVPCRVLSFREYLSEFCKTNTKYGTGTMEGKPYQTFYDTKGRVVFEGRRSDILKRHALISKHVDFHSKTVLDLGGNYGNASNLALGSGASQVHVVDYDKHVIGAAVTLGVLVEASGARVRRRVLFLHHRTRKAVGEPMPHDPRQGKKCACVRDARRPLDGARD